MNDPCWCCTLDQWRLLSSPVTSPGNHSRLAQELQIPTNISTQQMVLLISVKQSCYVDNLTVSPCMLKPDGVYEFEKIWSHLMNCYLVLLPKMVVAILSRDTCFVLDLSLKHFFSPPSCFSLRLLRWSTPKRSLQRPSCWLCILNCRMVSWEMFCQPKFGIQREEGSSHHSYSTELCQYFELYPLVGPCMCAFTSIGYCHPVLTHSRLPKHKFPELKFSILGVEVSSLR